MIQFQNNNLNINNWTRNLKSQTQQIQLNYRYCLLIVMKNR